MQSTPAKPGGVPSRSRSSASRVASSRRRFYRSGILARAGLRLRLLPRPQLRPPEGGAAVEGSEGERKEGHKARRNARRTRCERCAPGGGRGCDACGGGGCAGALVVAPGAGLRGGGTATQSPSRQRRTTAAAAPRRGSDPTWRAQPTCGAHASRVGAMPMRARRCGSAPTAGGVAGSTPPNRRTCWTTRGCFTSRSDTLRTAGPHADSGRR